MTLAPSGCARCWILTAIAVLCGGGAGRSTDNSSLDEAGSETAHRNERPRIDFETQA